MKFTLTEKEKGLKGIYQIKNLINNDFYIGSTIVSFNARFLKYKSSYKRYCDGVVRSFHPYLFNAYNKYGWSNFEFSIVESIEDSEQQIRLLEEKYIQLLKPVYNICKRPTRGGSPNSGRKLNKEWIEKIREKSKLYKHSNNEEIYNKVIKKNKDSSSIYKVWNINQEFVGSLTECSMFINIDITQILRWLDGSHKSRDGWQIIKIKSQKKKLRLILGEKEIIFQSLSECDKYLNMWRGYTSTKTIRGELILDKYPYEFIEDIVHL